VNLTLLIQGPVYSGGLSGKTWGKGKTRAPRENFVSFDASETILRNIKIGQDIFHSVIVSTWEGEETRFLEGSTHRFALLKEPDPGPLESHVRNQIKGIKHAHENNAVRQFQGIQNGIKLAQSLGSTHIVKIRTDQELDLKRLKAETLSNFKTHKDCILVPFIDLDVPWSIPDFYLAMSVDHGLTLSRIMSIHSRFHQSVHVDLFLKAMLIKYPDLMLSSLKEAFFHSAPAEPFEKVIRSKILEMFRPGSRELFQSIIWRGEKVIHQSSNFHFHGDTRQNTLDKISTKRNRVSNTKQALVFLTSQQSAIKLFYEIAEENCKILFLKKFGISTIRVILKQKYGSFSVAREKVRSKFKS